MDPWILGSFGKKSGINPLYKLSHKIQKKTWILWIDFWILWQKNPVPSCKDTGRSLESRLLCKSVEGAFSFCTLVGYSFFVEQACFIEVINDHIEF